MDEPTPANIVDAICAMLFKSALQDLVTVVEKLRLTAASQPQAAPGGTGKAVVADDYINHFPRGLRFKILSRAIHNGDLRLATLLLKYSVEAYAPAFVTWSPMLGELEPSYHKVTHEVLDVHDLLLVACDPKACGLGATGQADPRSPAIVDLLLKLRSHAHIRSACVLCPFVLGFRSYHVFFRVLFE
jgi:hypothetical protein